MDVPVLLLHASAAVRRDAGRGPAITTGAGRTAELRHPVLLAPEDVALPPRAAAARPAGADDGRGFIALSVCWPATFAIQCCSLAATVEHSSAHAEACSRAGKIEDEVKFKKFFF